MSDEPAQRFESLGKRFDPQWTAERGEHVLAGVHARRARRRAWALGGAGVAVVAAAVLITTWPRRMEAPGASATVQAAREPIRLGDGSLVVPLSAETALVAGEISSTTVTMRLDAGAARFAVAKNPGRLFRVQAGEVAVLVLGTEFTVERMGERVVVEVIGGHVRVEWPGGTADLLTGHRITVPPETVVPRAPAPPASDNPPTPPARAETVRPLRPRSPVEPGPAALDLGIEGLLRQADDERLAGRPAEAVPLLRHALARFGDDPRAPLAAFTLGRVLLDELDDPRAAAEAFARACAMDPDGPLAEDALAREVEAWARADLPRRARERALDYLSRYPDGRRVRAVKKAGAIE